MNGNENEVGLDAAKGNFAAQEDRVATSRREPVRVSDVSPDGAKQQTGVEANKRPKRGREIGETQRSNDEVVHRLRGIIDQAPGNGAVIPEVHGLNCRHALCILNKLDTHPCGFFKS